MTAASKPKLSAVLEVLEDLYGPQKPVGPNDPYEMILFANCAYPATDASCAKGFDVLSREVGLQPEKILAAPSARLASLMRVGMFPKLRAERLKDIARTVKRECRGDLKAGLKTCLREEKKQPGKGIRAAKNLLKQFPVIGEPGAEKILLFSRLAPVAAVPSACVGVPVRLWLGAEGKNYARDYRAAREILGADLPETFESRQRAYLLLKKHGQEICKRSKPKCDICPLSGDCAYFQQKPRVA